MTDSYRAIRRSRLLCLEHSARVFRGGQLSGVSCTCGAFVTALAASAMKRWLPRQNADQSLTQVPKKMPSVGDLDRTWRCSVSGLGIETCAIATDHFYPG